MAANRLYRSHNKVLGGVLAGIAEYFSVDVVLVRLLYVLLSLFSAGFPGLLVYVIFLVVTPEKPFDPYNSNPNL
ncbi:PspC domain-containing protein [Draconibacterium sp. IB214405]|uniref:PspC domain-containing protein n=1 Tax=Draconibacterium sp. IB214405 TaxID=3097352 RepID=UPI002A0D6762|nr:PspC domain-containing protein [Draconibacterium sp. IB214405]MDX8340480.1 PspC domain-containing protein [Draconibacterium sp. IB214405]